MPGKYAPTLFPHLSRALPQTSDVACVWSNLHQVLNSTLYDPELKMYKISESLQGQPEELGRMLAFPPGWLENESIWMHMVNSTRSPSVRCWVVDGRVGVTSAGGLT